MQPADTRKTTRIPAHTVPENQLAASPHVRCFAADSLPQAAVVRNPSNGRWCHSADQNIAINSPQMHWECAGCGTCRAADRQQLHTHAGYGARCVHCQRFPFAALYLCRRFSRSAGAAASGGIFVHRRCRAAANRGGCAAGTAGGREDCHADVEF